MAVVGQHLKTVLLHAPEPLFLGFLPQPGADGRLCPVLPALKGDGEVLRQHEGGFPAPGSLKTGNKINHVPGRPAAEAVKAAVKLHAGVFIVVERADAHPMTVYPDSVMLRSHR